MALVAITGGIGSGKSTVSKYLINKGYPLIDTDQIARDIIEPNLKAYNKIIKFFGNEIINEDLSINRQKLGDIIFNDESKRKVLNSIMHPIIRIEVLKKIFFNLLFGHKIIFIDVPLLFESKSLLKFVQKSVVVYCDRQQQIDRIEKRNQLKLDEIESRINSQIKLDLKCKMGDYVIDNSKDLENLNNEINLVLKKIEKLNLHQKNLTIFRFILLSSFLSIATSFYYFFKNLNFF